MREKPLKVIQFWVLRFQYFIGGMATAYIILYFNDALSHYSKTTETTYSQPEIDIFIISAFVGGVIIGILIALLNHERKTV